MAVPTQLLKLFSSFAGLDLRVSDLLRSNDAATDMENVNFRQTGAITKRKGYQVTTEDGIGGFGVTTYNNVDIDNGSVVEEVLTVDDNLHKLVTYNFTITYTGTDNDRTYYRFFPESDGVFYFEVYDDGVRVLRQNCGDGLTTNYTVASLITEIDSLTNFTCSSASGASATQAAFIPITKNQTITTSGYNVEFEAYEQVDTSPSNTNPLALHYADRTSTTFENASFTQINNIMYIATGRDELQKYDGNRIYRAGIPQHPNLTIADAGSGSTFTTGDFYSFLATYEYRDAKGNIITGKRSDVKTHEMAAAQDINATVTYLTNTDFNLAQAQVNGAQSTVNTITVDDSSELKVGDYIYIDDSVSSSVVSRRITAIPNGTSITVDGDAVTVGDNDYISTVRISLYRTENHSSTPNSPGLFYLVKEFINNRGGTTEVYTDSTADSVLTGLVQWVEPIKDRGLPPKAKYIDDWRGLLLLSGSPTNVNRVYYSDIDNPEYFPTNDNSFDLNNKVTGLKALENILYVFNERSINGVDGDLAQDSFQVFPASREGVGCQANHSIVEVQGRLMFLSEQGVFAIGPNGLEPVGSPIEPKFDIGNTFSFKQATAFNWQREKKYVLYMPVTPTNSSASSTDSEIYVFDYFRKAWLRWKNFNMYGGMTAKENDIYMNRRDGTYVVTQKVLQNQNEYDYVNHNEAITISYSSQWFTLGEPSLWKKFLRCKIHSYDTAVDDFEGDTFTVNVQTQHDYNTSITRGDLTYDFSGGAQGWGVGQWGAFPWGELRLPQLKRKLPSRKSRSMRVIFTNSTINQNVLISGYSLELVAPYRLGLKE